VLGDDHEDQECEAVRAAGVLVLAGLIVAVASDQNAPILYKNPKTPVEQQVESAAPHDAAADCQFPGSRVG
jgi:hypothetical protein